MFYRVPAALLEHCRQSPAFCEDLLTGDEEGIIETFHVDQGWDVIHYLLSPNRACPNQEATLALSACDWAITGRSRLHKSLDLGHGPARTLDAYTVHEVADVLQRFTEHDLREAFDPQAMDAAEVHPEIWTATVRTDKEKDEAWEYVWEHFTRLRQFYQRAAAGGHAVITWIIPSDERRA